MTRLLAVDDDTLMLSAVRQVLLGAGFDVDTATDGESALTMALRGCYDLVILDVLLPDVSGIEICQLLRRQSDLPILMLTGLGEVEARVEGLEAGADDYLAKPFSSRELVARVKAVLRRSTPGPKPASRAPASYLRVGGLEIDLVYRRASNLGEPLRLSPKEFDLLVFLASHPGRIFTPGDLLKEVWKYDNPSDTRTVSVHVWSLRQKLEADPSRPRLIETRKGKGYRLGLI